MGYHAGVCQETVQSRLLAQSTRLALPRKSELPVYIAPYGEPCRREGYFMSDFETLSLMLMILAIIIPLLVELIKSTKK